MSFQDPIKPAAAAAVTIGSMSWRRLLLIYGFFLVHGAVESVRKKLR